MNIDDILKEAEGHIKNLALATASKYAEEAAAAGKELLAAMKSDLEVWSQKLADKEFTEFEFELLVKSYDVEIVIDSLEQAGMSAIKADVLALNILDIIIDVAIKVITKLV